MNINISNTEADILKNHYITTLFFLVWKLDDVALLNHVKQENQFFLDMSTNHHIKELKVEIDNWW